MGSPQTGDSYLQEESQPAQSEAQLDKVQQADSQFTTDEVVVVPITGALIVVEDLPPIIGHPGLRTNYSPLRSRLYLL